MSDVSKLNRLASSVRIRVPPPGIVIGKKVTQGSIPVTGPISTVTLWTTSGVLDNGLVIRITPASQSPSGPGVPMKMQLFAAVQVPPGLAGSGAKGLGKNDPVCPSGAS